METLPALIPDLPQAEIVALAVAFRRANGPVMSLVNKLGGSFESQMGMIPDEIRGRIERVVERALTASYAAARQADRLPETGPR